MYNDLFADYVLKCILFMLLFQCFVIGVLIDDFRDRGRPIRFLRFWRWSSLVMGLLAMVLVLRPLFVNRG